MKKPLLFKIIFIFLFFINLNYSFGQDLILTKSKLEIKAKIQEVSPKIVKYQKFENLQGPIYSLLISEVIYIKYQNGTIDYFDKTFLPLSGNNNQSIISQKSDIPNLVNEPKSNLVESKLELNTKLAEQNNFIQSNSKQEEKLNMPILNENQISVNKSDAKSIVENFNYNTNKTELIIPRSKYSTRKKTWLISTILFSGVGLFSIIQTNSLYTDYKTSTLNANSLHSSITTYQSVTPIAFSLAGISSIGFISNLLKENKEKTLKISIENKISYNQIRFNYEF
ncbi:hypothetical protein VR611_06235 [Aquirufa nivalisilvae]